MGLETRFEKSRNLFVIFRHQTTLKSGKAEALFPSRADIFQLRKEYRIDEMRFGARISSEESRRGSCPTLGKFEEVASVRGLGCKLVFLSGTEAVIRTV